MVCWTGLFGQVDRLKHNTLGIVTAYNKLTSRHLQTISFMYFPSVNQSRKLHISYFASSRRCIMLYSTLALGLVAFASATGVLLPLYVYPSAVFGDGAANWSPALDAISSQSGLPWLVVINPDSGPGGTLQPGNNDQNYLDGTAKMNAHSNVKTIGYVRTHQATADQTVLQQNITAWKNWSTYTAADVHVNGIFFDEVVDNFDYMSQATSFAKSTFGDSVTTICNFGAAAPASYYSICDVVIAFESCLNCPDGPPYEGQATISANIPSGNEGGAAIIVHDFSGSNAEGVAADANLLQTYESTLKQQNVGWSYFCSGPYSDITSGPASVSQNAAALA